MKQSLLMILFASLVAATAHADEARVPDPVGKMTPPAGWNVDLGRSRGLEMAVAGEEHFAGAAFDVSGQLLMAPLSGGMLLVTEIATRGVPADPGAAAAVELHGVGSNVESLGETAKLVRWDISPDVAARVTEGKLEWTDASLGTTTIGRTLVFQTADHLVRITAECIIGTDAATLRAPCEAALATLQPLAAVGDRVPLTVAARPPPAADEPPSLRPGAPAIGERTAELPVVITVNQPEKKTDRRPLYVGGGLLLIAAAYLWNRRKKKTPAEAAGEETDKP